MNITCPILSIIVPVYNVEKYLSRCLESLINQTEKNIEIICVNDGSTDCSSMILDKYARLDSRIIVITQQNGGLSSARNTGIAHAKAPFITFVDSDDYVELTCYKNCLSSFKDEEIDVVFFGTNIVLEDDYHTHKIDSKSYDIALRGKIKLDNNLLIKTNVCAWNKLYRRSIIDKYEIFFPDKLLFEDNVFYWEYMSVALCGYFLQEKYYNYVYRYGSIMDRVRNGSDRAIEHLICIEKIVHFYVKWNLIDKMKAIILPLFISYFKFAYSCSTVKMKKQVLSEAKNLIYTLNLQRLYPQNDILIGINNDKFYKVGIPVYTFMQKLFHTRVTKKHKIYTIFGLKIKKRLPSYYN